MKNKLVTAFLALTFGVFGVHRFYLGQKVWGILMFLAAMLGILLLAAPAKPFPFIIVPAMIGFIDAILFVVMPQEDFHQKYNPTGRSGVSSSAVPVLEPAQTSSFLNPNDGLDYHRKKGIRAYRLENYELALSAFEDALSFSPEDPGLHFNLACCYAQLEEALPAFKHLGLAFQHGFTDTDKLYTHPAFNTLRQHPDFESFVRKIRGEGKAQFDLLEDLKARNILTLEEYEAQKKRLWESL